MARTHLSKPVLFLLYIPIGLFFIFLHNGCSTPASKPIFTSKIQLDTYLDTLYISRNIFDSVGSKGIKRIVLKFQLVNNNFTLNGWVSPSQFKGKFNPNPNLTFQIGNPDKSQPIVSGLNFGDQILHESQITSIKNYLNTTKDPFVIFIPEIQNQEVMYNIWTGALKPTFKKNLTLIPLGNTGLQTNPSPPKNYSEN